MQTTDRTRPAARPALAVAAAGSGVAGVIHAAAAGSHDGTTLKLLFALAAVAQIVWAVALLRRPTRAVVAAGVAANALILGAWLASRSVGLPFVAELSTPEVVGLQDGICALAALVAVMGGAFALARPVLRTAPNPAWSTFVTVMAIAVAVPALAIGHDESAHVHSLEEAAAHQHTTEVAADGHAHSHDDSVAVEVAAHDHGTATTDTTAPHDHSATTDTTGATHDHGTTSTTTSSTHDHGTTPGGTTPTTDGHDHTTTPTGPIIWLDDPRLTPAQRAAAQQLIDATTAGMARFKTVQDVKDAGYAWIGDGGGSGFEHYVSWSKLNDGRELDPNNIESIVVQRNADGTKSVASAMYILEGNKTMADVPDIAGELTTWHVHTNLCWDGTRLSGIAVNGVCTTGVLRVTPPMLHVWMVPRPCGPFEGIEGAGSTCEHSH